MLPFSDRRQTERGSIRKGFASDALDLDTAVTQMVEAARLWLRQNGAQVTRLSHEEDKALADIMHKAASPTLALASDHERTVARLNAIGILASVPGRMAVNDRD